MGPHNRSNGFKAMAEKYIQKNPDPNDPKVKNILIEDPQNDNEFSEFLNNTLKKIL